MPTTLTPIALRELEELLWNSRRSLSEIYREWRVGATVQEMAEQRSHEDLKKIKDTLSALRVLFGREPLSKRGVGRQQAIYEAAFWLNSDFYLSAELQDHFENILIKGEKTNTRRNGEYEPPLPPPRSVYKQARDNSSEGDSPGIYVLTKTSFKELHEITGKPLLVKIGWSNKVWDRISGAQTWDPDPLVILRIFPCKNPNALEAKFHICLDTLGLTYDNGGGKEWFHASLSLIDEIAKSLSLSPTENI